MIELAADRLADLRVAVVLALLGGTLLLIAFFILWNSYR